jgi:hypothetical protein
MPVAEKSRWTLACTFGTQAPLPTALSSSLAGDALGRMRLASPPTPLVLLVLVFGLVLPPPLPPACGIVAVGDMP